LEKSGGKSIGGPKENFFGNFFRRKNSKTGKIWILKYGFIEPIMTRIMTRIVTRIMINQIPEQMSNKIGFFRKFHSLYIIIYLKV
jgi:hypothetical protein